MLARLLSKEVTNKPYVLQEKLESKITFCRGAYNRLRVQYNRLTTRFGTQSFKAQW